MGGVRYEEGRSCAEGIADDDVGVVYGRRTKGVRTIDCFFHQFCRDYIIK